MGMLTLPDQDSSEELAPVGRLAAPRPARQYDQRPMTPERHMRPVLDLLSSGPWIEPPTVGCDQRIRLWRPPRARLVLVHGNDVAEHGVHDAPGLLDIVLTRKTGGIAPHRVEQELFVGAH